MKEQSSQYLSGRTGNDTHLLIKAHDRSYFSLLKKEIHGISLSIGFSDQKIAEIDIITAELASNLVKYGGGGNLLVKEVKSENGIPGIEIISIDNGPGIGDLPRMMLDGVSSNNTLGVGLGAIKRLSDVFQVYSMKAWGTIILVRVFTKKLPAVPKPARVEIRSIVFPKQGETACGDGFFHKTANGSIYLFLGDGLGHGIEAANAVQKAGEAFLSCQETQPEDIIRSIDGAVKKTRGLVGTVAVFDMEEKSWRLCGVGNISTKITGPTLSRHYIAYNGIIGLNVPRTLNSQEIKYEKNQQVILCSDGIKSRWDLLKYTGILRFDLSVLATCVIKDFGRNTDDTSVAACKLTF